MRRREFIAFTSAAATWPLVARAQKSTIPVIGLLHEGPPFQGPGRASFDAGLKEYGLIDGQTVRIVYRWAEANYDRLPAFAAELVALKPDLIIATGTPSAVALKAATTNIPTVFLSVGDPVGIGLVQSLSRPGGNMTGLAVYVPGESGEFVAKFVEIMRETIPSTSKIAVLINPGNQIHRSIVANDLPRIAQKLGVALPVVQATTVEELDLALASAVSQHADSMIVLADSFLNQPQVAALATERHLPALALYRLFARNGGLMSYGPDFADLFWRGGYYVDKILKGAKPADLPIQQPTKFELVINLKTAKALGIIVPPAMLARADEVIE